MRLRIHAKCLNRLDRIAQPIMDLSRICAAPSARLGHLALFLPMLNADGGVIEAVDVLEDGGFGLATGLPCAAPDEFCLDGFAEGFDSCIAVAIGLEDRSGETDAGRRERKMLERRLAPLADLLEPVAPSNDLFARIAERADTPLSGIHIARSADGLWKTIADGIEVKTLWHSRQSGRRAYMLRMQPGAVMPTHNHLGDEESLMLEGDMLINGVAFGPGDFQVAFAGTKHPLITTRGGCLCFVSLSH
jgi:anti-sigma factor ChrR (cupin superfamily)